MDNDLLLATISPELLRPQWIKIETIKYARPHNRNAMAVFESNAEDGAQTGTIQTVEELMEAVSALESGDVDTLTLIGEYETLREVRDDFSLAGRVQNHVESGDLTLLVSEDVSGSIHTDGQTAESVVTASSETVTIQTSDRTDVATVESHLDSLVDNSDEFPLRTAAYDSLRDELASQFGEEFSAHFEEAYENHDFSGSVDEVMVLLLLAAYNQEELYQVSRVGENTGVASTATFSRKKSELEEAGIVETEKVSADVGRPRQRLVYSGTEVASSPMEVLGVAAQEV